VDIYKEYVLKTKNALVVNDDKGFLVYTIHEDFIFIHDVYSRVFVSLTGFIEMIRKQLIGLGYDYERLKFIKGEVRKISLTCDETLKIYEYYKFKIKETSFKFDVEKEIQWAI
jgi:hypothetical protein